MSFSWLSLVMPSASVMQAEMKFETETEPLPANRPFNWRKLIIIIVCTAIIFGLLIIAYVGLEAVNSEEINPGSEPGLRGPDRPTEQRGALGSASHPGDPELHSSTGPKEKPTPSWPAGGLKTATEGIQNLTTTKGIIEGIIESVNREEILPGPEPGLQSPDRTKGQRGALGRAGHSGEPPLQTPTRPETKIEPSGPAGPLGETKTLTEGIKNLTASKGIVEGIISGTTGGIFVIPLDSLEQRTVSITSTTGVAFNWQTRKVYWIEYQVGIKISDLDGSSAELLISDTDFLCGLVVDQITGNFYYGVRGSNASIRVCDSMGKTCVTVASVVKNVGFYIWDIALFPSEGPGDKKSVTRANMDGTNATVIIREHIHGLCPDEFTEKLYWANYNDKSIGHHDLNGYNRDVLLKTTINPYDIAVDGDGGTLYFGGDSPDGVYSVSSSRKVSCVAKTTGSVLQIALYGRNKVSSRPNPCENSRCANLCVLSRASYKCL